MSRRDWTDEQRKAFFAQLGQRLKKKKKAEKKTVKTGAKRLGTTQKLLKRLREEGELAEPNRLVMNQKVYRIMTDTKTKTAGTKGDKVMIGRVTKRATPQGKSGIPYVRLEWEKPPTPKWNRNYSKNELRAKSIISIGGTFVPKTAELEEMKEYLRKQLARRMKAAMPTPEDFNDIPPPAKFSYSTWDEYVQKQKEAFKKNPTIFGRDPDKPAPRTDINWNEVPVQKMPPKKRKKKKVMVKKRRRKK